MNKIAIVTGGTSGIGKATAEALIKNGFTVYEFSRRENGAEGINHLSVDITDENAVCSAVKYVFDKEKRIDLLVNNAGFGISGAIEFTDTDAAKRLFDVNFFGTVNVSREVIPIMRSRKCGRIINVSSVAAPIAIPFQAFYSATKAAVNKYTLALANELRPYGVTVCAVQPGDIKTGFTGAREKVIEGDGIYGGRIGRSVAQMEKDEQNGMAPETIGNFIAKIALKKKIKPIYTVGFSYKLICTLSKAMPDSLQNYIVGKIYAK